MLDIEEIETFSWRHRRIWIDPKLVSNASFVDGLSKYEIEYIFNWVSQNKPLVGRSRISNNSINSDLMPTGLMIYLPNNGKERVNLWVRKTSILKVEEPLVLRHALDFLPEKNFIEIKNFLDKTKDYPICIRVFGSLFWSYEAKQNYMNPNSDLDILVQFNDRVDLIDLANLICNLSKGMSIRLDGEFEFSNQTSISWRELVSGSKDLLVKSDFGPSLCSKERILEEFYAQYK
jgi:phosphoribosyl-dephospho-CoA transferase